MQTVKGHVHKTSDTPGKAEHIAPALLMVFPQVDHYVDGHDAFEPVSTPPPAGPRSDTTEPADTDEVAAASARFAHVIAKRTGLRAPSMAGGTAARGVPRAPRHKAKQQRGRDDAKAQTSARGVHQPSLARAVRQKCMHTSAHARARASRHCERCEGPSGGKRAR